MKSGIKLPRQKYDTLVSSLGIEYHEKEQAHSCRQAKYDVSKGGQSIVSGLYVQEMRVYLLGVYISVILISLVPSQVNTSVVIGVNGLAEMNSVLEFFTQNPLTGVSRHLQEEEACVGLR